MAVLDQVATPASLRRLLDKRVLDPEAYERALSLAGITPDGLAWRRFLDRLLAGLGTVLVLSGIVFFFAYNWADLHRFAKFSILETALLITVALAWRLGADSQGGRSALLGAAVLPGVLLALYGQTYQTGADPYGLFLTWSLLILPWVMISRSVALWFLLLILSNLSLMLWWIEVFRPPEWLAWSQSTPPLLGLGFVFLDADLSLLTVTLNVLALLGYEILAGRIQWLEGRWMPRLVMLLILATLLPPVLRGILIAHHEMLSVQPAPLVWFALTAGLGWIYRYRLRDLFMLAALALAAIVIVTSFLTTNLHFDGPEGMLFLSLMFVLLTGAAVYWLRRTAKTWEES